LVITHSVFFYEFLPQAIIHLSDAQEGADERGRVVCAVPWGLGDDGKGVAGGNKSRRQRFFRAMAANDQTKTLVMVILINIIGLIILWLWTP
jgi:hypothetical protein